ncbi:hypothetical protein J2S13_001276 [Oikeobacillus pervagus]|uniref:Uncharacterized protein n=1 Tax=Oikeobacillus pervagus TaxID=1325931 RepID=A0AAJ1SXZ3_9BACI|nr:hypothetical protein [Oikeobacillus pervagus]MDQ0214879.1 hypothetical protein [Oikeobacillus pervagus]
MPTIRYKDFKVDTIFNTSSICYGMNIQYRWKHDRQSNEGFGQISGHSNVIKKNMAIIKSSEK